MRKKSALADHKFDNFE